jgi:transcriptional regulator GlxA family with amidase domain
MAIVCAEENADKHSIGPLEAWLRECRQRGIPVGALDTGTYILARARMLDNRRCTIHWEKLPAFSEDDEIWTCAEARHHLT